MQTKTYAQVISGVQALVGATLESGELLRMAATINSRARRAYEAFDLWPRWLVIGEYRHVNGDKTVPDTITGSNTVDTFLRIHQKDPWDNLSSAQWDFNTDSTGARLVNYAYAYAFERATFSSGSSDGTTLTVATSTTHGLIVGDSIQINNAVTSAGVLLPHLDVAMTVATVPSTTSFTATLDVAQSVSDASVTGDIQSPKVYATYKKALDITYGDGVADGTDTITIPLEWFEYVCRGTYADWLRSEGQTEKAVAEDNEANKILSEQIERADNSQSHPALATRFETHLSSQAR